MLRAQLYDSFLRCEFDFGGTLFFRASSQGLEVYSLIEINILARRPPRCAGRNWNPRGGWGVTGGGRRRGQEGRRRENRRREDENTGGEGGKGTQGKEGGENSGEGGEESGGRGKGGRSGKEGEKEEGGIT